MNEQVKKDIISLIENSRDAVVCSVDENGFPNAKAMFRRKNDGMRAIWFSSNRSAIHTQQWNNNSKASVYFCNSEDISSLLLIGHMRVYTDNETKQLYWEQGDEEYYVLGPTDPDYCMLCFTAENGVYMSQKKHLFNIDDKMGAVTYKYDKGWCPE